MQNESIITDPERRNDFLLLFDVQDGNPNGDPDAGNLPRVDPETMHGLVSDVCLKRKVRNWVEAQYDPSQEENGDKKIYIKHHGILRDEQEKAYESLELEEGSNARGDHAEARDWMCENYYDIRTFGAVMSTTDFKCGQVRGPVQMTFARSVDPVTPMDLSITRVAITNPEGESQQSEQKRTEMGRKALIPYGLYRSRGFFNPTHADETGFTREDLRILWQSLISMWTLDRSASRGYMACRGLYIFSHENAFGRAPAHQLFDRIEVTKKTQVDAPRDFNDYQVNVKKPMPEGVQLTELVGSNV